MSRYLKCGFSVWYSVNWSDGRMQRCWDAISSGTSQISSDQIHHESLEVQSIVTLLCNTVLEVAYLVCKHIPNTLKLSFSDTVVSQDICTDSRVL